MWQPSGNDVILVSAGATLASSRSFTVRQCSFLDGGGRVAVRPICLSILLTDACNWMRRMVDG